MRSEEKNRFVFLFERKCEKLPLFHVKIVQPESIYSRMCVETIPARCVEGVEPRCDDSEMRCGCDVTAWRVWYVMFLRHVADML